MLPFPLYNQFVFWFLSLYQRHCLKTLTASKHILGFIQDLVLLFFSLLSVYCFVLSLFGLPFSCFSDNLTVSSFSYLLFIDLGLSLSTFFAAFRHMFTIACHFLLVSCTLISSIFVFASISVLYLFAFSLLLIFFNVNHDTIFHRFYCHLLLV